MEQEYGILIIAQGAERYINMSRNIAMSLTISNPKISKVLVTDSTDKDLERYYDQVIPISKAYGTGYEQKLNVHKYSPFKRTMFIDVDCLVIRDIHWLFDRFRGHAVSVIGKKLFSGPLIGTTVEALKQKKGIEYLLTFNGGVYYFENTPEAVTVFEEANELYKKEYDDLGLCKFNGRPGDEPVMSIAMAMNKVEPISDDLKGMYTPVGQNGKFEMDALSGHCEFYKYEDKVSPAIMHFGGGYPEAFHYRRERRKIKLVYDFGFPRTLTSVLVNVLYNPGYILYVFFYRLIKLLLKGKKANFSILMPMFRFE